MMITDRETVLFQGDSITDAGRHYEDANDLGTGYPAVIAAWFSALYPAKNVRFLNRGISGHRAGDLRGRWKKDCLDLKPDWVSVLIGINDTWRRYDSNDLTSAAVYEDNLRAILTATRDMGAKIILIEPFLLPSLPDRLIWREDLDPKIDVARRLAREFQTLYIPMDGLFQSAATQREMSFWLPDGVHPSLAGHSLISQAWLRAIGAI